MSDHDAPVSETPSEAPITSDDFVSVDSSLTSDPNTAKPKSSETEILSQELRALNLAIEIYPQAAANYAARGDHFRRQGERVLAVADYRQALELAQSEILQSQWGFVAQALRDRLHHTLLDMGEIR